ncbi:hypothetical protein ZOSMA_156G00030 [Zostera marina]|uniref:Small ribosomal subunit protein mS41 SAM domain-containing protein n=1 Tax=Zostera marina TaxID=29655 RepID=A0A0K9PXJ0_ZOSMR|nr:hypothetical protein ZOSMA_156G00030 [Zostera marina]
MAMVRNSLKSLLFGGIGRHSVDYSQSFSTKSNPYVVKVGIPEFLKAVGNGVETHMEKLEKEVGDFQKLLITRTLRLKSMGIPCKHRKLILRHTHKYRLGLWRPRADAQTKSA